MAVHQVLIDPRPALSNKISTGFALPSHSLPQIPSLQTSDSSNWSFNFNNKGTIVTGVLIVLVLGLLYYTSTESEDNKKNRVFSNKLHYF